MSKFTFGATTTTAPTTGFTFNTQSQAGRSFGTSTTFGATTTATPAPAMQPAAQTSMSTINFSFGSNPTPATQPTGSMLGTAAAATTASTLFSTTTPAQPTQLGQPTQPAQSTGLTFGTPTAKPTGLTFGTPTTGTAATSAIGLTTGSLTTGGLTTGGLSFGTSAATTTTGLSFGTPTSSTTTGGLNFGAAPATGGLSFGTTTSSAASAGTGLSFGATTTTTTAPSMFGSSTSGIFGAKPTATTALTTTTLSTTNNRGLGGLDVSISNKGLAQGNTSPTAAKENLLPNELMQTIEGFKEFVKIQKVLSSDIARGSARPLNRCAEDTASLMEMLTTLAGSVQRDRFLADKLKLDTAKALQNAEIAQRTHDTPAGLQYENNAPLLFFIELAEQFENDLMLFKSQIETTEKHIQTMMSPKTLTPQELTMAMSKLHESLVAVAGRLQGIHAKVQQQKEQYLNFRKYVLKDNQNVFEENKLNTKTSRSSIGRITSGPTPFGPGNRSFMSSTALNSSQTPNLGTPNPLGKN
ncbi:nucleoporin p58/p45 isoform X2 [Phymastichus coffea]|uniref:nucleoporin p58/p45 isoform X2 n=1 Tax=Phymastichus coffea TaxID=108790 RepID=UPI00273C6244|nr:nucleoporin p58/p45 isoform X2 [Phymastichus coffea]